MIGFESGRAPGWDVYCGVPHWCAWVGVDLPQDHTFKATNYRPGLQQGDVIAMEISVGGSRSRLVGIVKDRSLGQRTVGGKRFTAYSKIAQLVL